MEKIKLAKEEKEDRRDFGGHIGPLPPEYVKHTYDNAYHFREGMNEIAESEEDQALTRKNPDAALMLLKDAKRTRKEGSAAVQHALKETQKYFGEERVAASYHEQAKADMEADLEQKKAA